MDHIPARLSVVTLGVRQMPTMRAFYTGLGWAEQPGASDQHVMYLVGGTMLALYSVDDLATEAAPGEPLTKHGWGGHTFALNVDERDHVDDVVRLLQAKGARKVGQVEDRPWGGRSGYVADPEGNRWEVAWAPGLRFDDRGAVVGGTSE